MDSLSISSSDAEDQLSVDGSHRSPPLDSGFESEILPESGHLGVNRVVSVELLPIRTSVVATEDIPTISVLATATGFTATEEASRPSVLATATGFASTEEASRPSVLPTATDYAATEEASPPSVLPTATGYAATEETSRPSVLPTDESLSVSLLEAMTAFVDSERQTGLLPTEDPTATSLLPIVVDSVDETPLSTVSSPCSDYWDDAWFADEVFQKAEATLIHPSPQDILPSDQRLECLELLKSRFIANEATLERIRQEHAADVISLAQLSQQVADIETSQAPERAAVVDEAVQEEVEEVDDITLLAVSIKMNIFLPILNNRHQKCQL
jgi:hypothetical protein